jgi:uncharacterized protein YcfJ
MFYIKYILSVIILGTLVSLNAELIMVDEQVEIKKPIRKKVKIGTRCKNEMIEVSRPYQSHRDTNSIGLDTIIGGVLGVAVGNQIGGDGAKVLGGITGMHLANESRVNKVYKQYKEVRKCYPVYEYQIIKEVVSYKNCATYMGERVCKESISPLNYLEVSHKIYLH